MRTNKSTLDTYLARDVITDRQHQAGTMFLHDWKKRYPGVRTRSLTPKVQRSAVAGFDMGGIGAARCGKALQALGPLRHVVVAVVVEDKNAGEWMAGRGGKATEGIALLKAALSELASFYQIERDDAEALA